MLTLNFPSGVTLLLNSKNGLSNKILPITMNVIKKKIKLNSGELYLMVLNRD